MKIRLALSLLGLSLLCACAADGTANSAQNEVYEPPYTPTGSNVIRRDRNAAGDKVTTGNREAAESILRTPQGSPTMPGAGR